MASNGRYISEKRREAWDYGNRHRDRLVDGYVIDHRLTERPFLKDIIDDLIEEQQHVRLLSGPLRLDTYGQTERIGGRIEITVNSRINEMIYVKDVDGVANATKWHESVHAERDLGVQEIDGDGSQQVFTVPGFEKHSLGLIVCRDVEKIGYGGEEREREFFAENAGIAAAISGADLLRCEEFLEFKELVILGGDITLPGWDLIKAIAGRIGVNRTAITRYFCQRGIVQTEQIGGRQRLIAVVPLFGDLQWP